MEEAPQVAPRLDDETMRKMAMEYQAYVQNTGLMQQVAREMKEIPELPSEVPTDVHPLLQVEFPEEGGVLTYMGGYDHPYKGFPLGEFVDKIDYIKKTQRAVLSSLYHSFKSHSWLTLSTLIFVPWILNDLLKAYIYPVYRMVDRFKLKPIRYCTSMRELHRAFSKDSGEYRGMIRDIMCMLLEYDNAYRFRFQDIIVELDKDKLKKNPGKELNRLFALLISREIKQEVKDTWKLVQYFLPTYLFFNRKLRKNIIDIFTELDLEKVALSVEDKTFSEKRIDYKFGFMQ